jgi:D-glycero-D-manno-heptose 1,7-bisphosphate phosphatase
MRRAIFLDLDGTVRRAVSRPEIGPHAKAWAPWYLNEVNFEPNLKESVKIFKDFGYLVIVATNQPDVAYGNITRKRWQQIHDATLAEADPDDCYVCPHPQGAGCPCKKPAPGLLLMAASQWNINLAKSFMVGDTEKDTGAGKAAGCKTILIRREYNLDVEANIIVPNLLSVASVI